MFGHMVKYCHTISCYMCDRFGQKAKHCSTKTTQLKRSINYVNNKKVRREKEKWHVESQRKFSHIKQWVKNTSLVNIVEETSNYFPYH